MMNPIEISHDTTADKLVSLAISIHRATDGLPVAIKSRDRPGVLVADGRVIDQQFESPELDRAFEGDHRLKMKICTGQYKGQTMYASAIRDEKGLAIAVLGIIDSSGMLDLTEVAQITERLKGQFKHARSP